MKKVIIGLFCVIAFLSLTSFLFAVDENTYVQFAADSIIVAHKLKGNPQAMQLWAQQMRKKHPDFLNQDWQEFERRLEENPALKKRVYSKILDIIKAKGYNARIVTLHSGATAIDIAD